MPTVADCLEHARWLVEKGRGNEPAKLIMPKVEAQRRKANKEERTRVQFDETPEGYADWWKQIDRYRTLVGNPVLASHIMVEILGMVSDEAIQARAGEDTPDKHSDSGKERDVKP